MMLRINSIIQKIFRQHDAVDAIREYLKTLGANRFGACRAVGRNQLRLNVQNCFSPLS